MRKLHLVCKTYEPRDAKFRLDGREVFVYDEHGTPAAEFDLMRWALHEDIQSAEGSGACVLEWIRKVEAGEIDLADVDGNAWVMNITRDKVWFEGLYSQGEGGEVTFDQYKLAVQTYVRFLSDSQRRPIEVEFPLASQPCSLPAKPQLTIRIQPRRPIERDRERHLVMTPRISVVDQIGTPVPAFKLMCTAIEDAIDEGESARHALEQLRVIESCKSRADDLVGNNWRIRISRNKVEFENLHDPDQHGEVSFAHFRLAARLYLEFLFDSDRRPVEMPFKEPLSSKER